MKPPAPHDHPPTRETLWFAAIALPIAWLLAAWWFQPGHPRMLAFVIGWVPALVGLACAAAFRREPPRAMGFDFTGWSPWLAGIAFPLAVTGLAVGVGFLLENVLGVPHLIRADPGRLRRMHSLISLDTPSPGRVFLLSLVWLAPWFVLGIAYRYDWRGRLQKLLPDSLQWVDWLLWKVLWGTTLTQPQLAAILGEEMGFRGYVARRWAERPVTAAVISATLGTAFWLPFVFMPTISGSHVEHALRLVELWSLGVVLVALYRWSGSIWPAAVAHFSFGFWDDVTVGAPGSPGIYVGTLGGLPTLMVLRTAVDVCVALAILAHLRATRPARRTVAVVSPRLGAPSSAAAAGRSGAAARASAATRPSGPKPVRGASAGLMLLMILWGFHMVVTFRTLLDWEHHYVQFVAAFPGAEHAVLADILVHAGWLAGGVIGLYMLARTDRGTPSYWIVYVLLTAAAFALLLATWPYEQTDRLVNHRLAWIVTSLLVAVYMMFSRGVRQVFGSNGFSLGALEGLRRRLHGF